VRELEGEEKKKEKEEKEGGEGGVDRIEACFWMKRSEQW
jgi:hypothetical protein